MQHFLITRRYPRVVAGAVSALVLAASGAAFGSSASAKSTTATSAASSKHFVIGFVNPSQAQPALDQWQQAAGVEAKALGDKFITASAGFDPNTEVEATEAMISRHVDAIITAPLDPALLDPIYAKAKAKGIKVLLWQATAPSATNTLTYNTKAAAEADVAGLAAQLKKEGKPCKMLVMQGVPTVPSLAAYRAGQNVGVKTAHCTVLNAQTDTSDDITGAATIANSWKTQYGSQATAISCYNDTCPLGVVSTFSSTFDPIVNGTGGGPQNIQLLDEHKEAEESVQDSASAGQAQAWLANQILLGHSVPKSVVGQYGRLTPKDGAAWLKQQAKLQRTPGTIKLTTIDGHADVLVDGTSA